VRWGWGLVRLPEVRWAGVATICFGAGAVAQLLGTPAALAWGLFAVCYVAGGWEPALSGLRALRRWTLDVDVLMVVAAIAAAAIGQVFDGALLIVIFATSGGLEAVATKRTEDSVRALLTLAPERATKVTPDGDEETVDTAALTPGAEVLVRPGERIGADGVVASGASDVDQASITGEPLPIPKAPGDEVFAGTSNGTGALRVRVTRPAHDSVVARIVALVEEASATKARAQLFIERIEQRYSVGVVAATLALFFVPLALGGALQPTLLRAMTFMIVASPCAVVLATMPPLLSAIANAGRHGVLVKSAVVMEQLATVGRVAFDKTGTLTEGTPRVAEIRATGTLDEHTLLALAAAAERPSEHPVGRAIAGEAAERALPLDRPRAFASIPGRGVTAQVGGHRVEVLRPGSVTSPPDTLAAAVADLECHGRTAVVVEVDGRPQGVIALADRLRPHARETVAALTELTGATPALLTGDNAAAARRLASEVGIEDVHAELLPDGKAATVRAMEVAGTPTLLVGDGVNDAPALAAAHLGVAMGRHGSDLALETADAVIVRDELATLPAMIDISRRARRLIVQNLAIAATFIVVLVAWDLLGHLPLPLGVAGHEGSTVLVGLNGLRLLRAAAWRRGTLS
jgi:cation-transporting P-type ATPase J